MSNRALVVVGSLAAGWLLVSGASALAQTDVRTRERGERVYRRACASCHGRSGRGDGPAAASLDPRPRDFTSGKYKFRSTPSGSPPTDEDLYRTISSGIPRTYMFGWEDLLSESDRRAVVRYIKNFSEAFEEEPTPIDVPEATPATPEALVEGKSLYMVMQCWTCHGPEGRGDGASAGDLKDEWGRDMEAFDFTVGAYKRGTDGESVFKTFETGLNGTPMPSYSGAFLFGSEHVRLSTYRDVYDESDLTGLESYLRSQPTASEIAQMTELERRRLESRRKWSLVHYVRSLSREPGLFHWLFTADTEVTP